MQSRWARVGRGASAAAFATVVAAVSHGSAGGSLSPFGIAVAVLISTALCTILTGRTLSLARLAAAVAVSQLLFHGLFSGLGAPVAVAHSHLPPVLDASATAHGDSAMWLAHAAAGGATIVVLRYAEIAFWGLAATARIFLARLVAVLAPVATWALPPAAPAWRTPQLPAVGFYPSSLTQRGPPAPAAS